MKRIGLFEFLDYNWLPAIIREGATNVLNTFHKRMGSAEVLAILISDVRTKATFHQVVDIGSGSGGPMIEAINAYNQDHTDRPVELLLTDLFPQQATVDTINGSKIPNVTYRDSPLDATTLESAPQGLKTMIASFHHMPPDQAKAILGSAQASQQPILIYELAKNNIPFIIWLLLLPLSLVILVIMCMILTLFVRPFSAGQLFFTFVIPIIPMVYAWDGQASLMRTYTFDDIRGLLSDTMDPNYHWEMNDAFKANGKKSGYFVLGYPKVD